jgi:hypothetical protein
MKLYPSLSEMTGKAISSVFRLSNSTFLTTGWDGTVSQWELKGWYSKESKAIPTDWFSGEPSADIRQTACPLNTLQLAPTEQLFRYSKSR